jgi:hypothetical protein
MLFQADVDSLATKNIELSKEDEHAPYNCWTNSLWTR